MKSTTQLTKYFLRSTIVLIFAIALAGCDEADLAELNSSLSELDSSLKNLNHEINGTSAPPRMASSPPRQNSKDYYTAVMDNCGFSKPIDCRISKAERAQREARQTGNRSAYIQASKEVMRGYEAKGQPQVAVTAAWEANRVVPSEPYFRTYLAKRGQKHLNADGSKPRDYDCTWDLPCAIRNTPGGAEAAAVIAYGGGKLVGAMAKAGPAPAGSAATSSSGKTFQCTVKCSTDGLAATMGMVGDSARDVTVSVMTSSASAASRLAMDDRAKICRQANLSAVATIVKPSCR